MLPEPDYSQNTLHELLDIQKHIDKESYPERAARLQIEIEKRQQRFEHLDSHHTESGFIETEEQLARRKEGNIIARHWRGDLSLGVSYWIAGTLLSLVMIGFSLLVGEVVAQSDLGRQLRGLFIILLYVVVTPTTIWQLVGIFRSAQKHESRGGQPIWAILAFIMVFIGGIRFSYDMIETGFPFIIEGGRMIAGDSNVPDTQFRLMNNATELELASGIEYGAAEQLEKLLTQAPDVTLLHLNNNGGRIAEAIKIVKLVKRFQLNTYTRTECNSACTLVFLAGKERLLANEGKLGFHSASVGSVSGSDVQELNEDLRAELMSAGISTWFVEKVTKVSADDLWYPKHHELKRAKVITDVVNKRDYAPSGIADWQTPTGIEDELVKHALYQAMNQTDPKGFAVVSDIMSKGISEGIPTSQIGASIREYVYVDRIGYYLNQAGDEQITQYYGLLIKQMRYFQASQPRFCAYYSFPESFPHVSADDVNNQLTSELQEDEQSAIVQLVKSISEDNYVSSDEQQSDSIIRVVNQLNDKDPIYSRVLSAPADHTNNLAEMCKVSIEFNLQLMTLPRPEFAALIRSFFRPQNKEDSPTDLPMD